MEFTMSDAPLADRSAYTIDEFCHAHRISRRKFYDLIEQGIGPRLMRIGVKVLISTEAATAWRAEREAAAQQAA
jgi:predicted DNA-binding transcriptional regulator AlpA